MNDLASNSVFMAAGLSNGVEGTHSCFSQILMTTAIECSTPKGSLPQASAAYLLVINMKEKAFCSTESDGHRVYM
jgi:hypothetical protein